MEPYLELDQINIIFTFILLLYEQHKGGNMTKWHGQDDMSGYIPLDFNSLLTFLPTF